jgi:hypothetical protein
MTKKESGGATKHPDLVIHNDCCGSCELTCDRDPATTVSVSLCGCSEDQPTIACNLCSGGSREELSDVDQLVSQSVGHSHNEIPVENIMLDSTVCAAICESAGKCSQTAKQFRYKSIIHDKCYSDEKQHENEISMEPTMGHFHNDIPFEPSHDSFAKLAPHCLEDRETVCDSSPFSVAPHDNSMEQPLCAGGGVYAGYYLLWL